MRNVAQDATLSTGLLLCYVDLILSAVGTRDSLSQLLIWDRVWSSIISVPDRCLFIFLAPLLTTSVSRLPTSH